MPLRLLLTSCFLITLLPDLTAAPMLYRVSMKIGGNIGTEQPIPEGAQLEITYQWDPASLAPFDSGPPSGLSSLWPLSNTTVSMKLSGTTAHDGVYPGELNLVVPNGWLHLNRTQGYDAIDLPRIRIPIGDEVISVNGFFARFSTSFFEGPGTIYPKPFLSSEATWDLPLLGNPRTSIYPIDISGFAMIVPEPTAISLAASSALITASRCRRRERHIMESRTPHR